MARVVNHAKRKRMIALKAMHLFSQVGYDNVSLLMIADAAGVSRTVLYRYFCSKREVLDAAICEVTGQMSEKCNKIVRSRDTIVNKLVQVCHEVADVMYENKDFLVAVFDFVIGMVRTGIDMNATIRTFTKGTRDVLRMLIEHGIKNGELAPILQVDRTTDVLYSEFESCALRIVIGNEKVSKAAKVRFSDVIRAISNWQ